MMMRKCLLACILIFAFCFTGLPLALAGPAISADASCLYDADANQVLWGKNIHQKRPPASTTKMMTGILTRNYCDMAAEVVISQRADRTGGTAIGVKTGQVWKVEDLLKVAMARSANDACVALAEYIAGSEALFGMLMTKKAAVIGARGTNFVNASGLPADGHYSSAYDLVRIGTVLQHDPYLKKLVASAQIEVKHPAYQQRLTLSNTNRLLTSYPGANGIKTGTTDAAGNCLVASASRQGRNLIAVVLHSNDRYQDSRSLLDYGYQSTRRVRLLLNDEPYKYLRVQNGTKYKVAVQAARDSQLIMDAEDKHLLEQSVSIDYYPRAKIVKGQKLGTLLITYCGEKVDTVPLVAAEEIDARSKITRLFKGL